MNANNPLGTGRNLKMSVTKKQSQIGRGRPKGATNKITREIRSLAQEHCEEALAKIVHLMRSAEREETQLAAAKELIDRGYGKSPIAIGGDPSAGPVRLEVITGVPRGDDED